MKNKSGQALIEFILILPVLLLLIFALVDFGRIILCKTHLEGVMNEVSNLPEDKLSSYLKKDTDYNIKYTIKIDEYKNITLTTNLELVTPGLKNILKNPYEVKVERSVVYE